MQAQGHLVRTGVLEAPLGGASATARALVQEGGSARMGNLWRGNVTSIVASATASAGKVATAVPAIVLKFLTPSDSSAWQRVASLALAATASAFAVSVVTYPLTYARTVLALDVPTAAARGLAPAAMAAVATARAEAPVGVPPVVGAPPAPTRLYRNAWDAVRAARASEGVAGLYRGFWLGALCLSLHSISKLAALECVGAFGKAHPELGWLAESDTVADVATSHAIAAVGLCVADAVVYPLDTVRVRWLLTVPQATKYTVLYYAQKLVAEEGVAALFRGVHVQLARNAVLLPLLLGFDVARRAILPAA
jgi:hypothetical protein